MFTKQNLKLCIPYVALVIVVIMLIGYKKFHRTVTGVLMTGTDVDIMKLSDVVVRLTLLYSKVQKFKYTPMYTKHLSHWSLLVETKKGYQVVLSPHENNLLRVIFVKDGTKMTTVNGKKHFIIPFRNYDVGDSYQMFGSNTALDYVKRMDELNSKKKYDIINYNCQYVVAETMMTFDPMLYVPYTLGKKLVKLSTKEMLSKKTRL